MIGIKLHTLDICILYTVSRFSCENLKRKGRKCLQFTFTCMDDAHGIPVTGTKEKNISVQFQFSDMTRKKMRVAIESGKGMKVKVVKLC